MISPAKQRESDPANCQQNRVGAKPKPVTGKFGKADGSYDQKDKSRHQYPAEDMKSAKPRINAITEDYDILHSATDCDCGNDYKD